MPTLSPEELVAGRFYHAFQPGNAAALSDVLAPDWVDHTLPPGRAQGIAGMQQALQQLQTLLPDLTTKVVKMITAADTVAVHLIFSGTHMGEAFGFSPTHRPVSFIAFDMHRISGGRIVESWHLEDNLALLTQIGIFA
jgi:predicted ester cyclase